MAQQATGTISGTVRDASDAVMPGVTMTLSNPGVIGGNQTSITDERGTYQFVRLVPGTYSVRAELLGFRSAARNDAVVNADVTVRVDLTIQIGSVEETITVSGAAPLLDTSTTQTQTVMDRNVLDAIPSGNSLWAIGAMVPGVMQTTYDVGGTKALDSSTQQVHGSVIDENRFMIDGMNVGGTGGGGGGVYPYYDSKMFEEINYQVGQAPAEYMAGGVLMNMITRTGTNTFHGTGDLTGMNEHLMANNISPALRQELLAQVPAYVLRVNPSIEPSNKVKSSYDLAASLSGPITPDKLWFAFTARRQKIDQINVGSYNPDGTLSLDDSQNTAGAIKINWQVMSGSTLAGLYNRNNKWRFHRLDSVPGALFIERAATFVQDLPTDIAQLKWTSVLSSKMLLDVGGSLMHGPNKNKPQPEVHPGTIPRVDLVSQIVSDADGTYTNAPNDNLGLYTSFSYVAGVHNLKFGYQAARQTSSSYAYSMSNFPSGFLAQYRNGVPDSVVVYNTPRTSEAGSVNQAWYGQDKWTPVPKLTLNVGLRLQKTKGFVPAHCQPESIFIVGKCYDRIENVPNWLDLAPRFGLIYDLFGHGRTALKLGASRYLHGTATGYPSQVDPVKGATETRPWTDTNRDLIPQLSELGTGTGFNLGASNRYDSEVVQPYTNELSAEIEQQFGDLMFSVGFTRRTLRRQVGSKNLLVPRESYIPLQVTEVVSGRQVTVYNQAPQTRGLFDLLYDNYPEMDTDFNGVDINFTKRMSKGWMLMGGLNLGKQTGETYGDPGRAGVRRITDLNNPNFTFRRDGVLGKDIPVSLKASGSYNAPLGIQVSGSYQYYAGFPEDVTVQVTRSTVALTQVNQNLRVEQMGFKRLPSNNFVNVRFAKVVRFGTRRVAPSLDIFNLFNAGTIQQRSSQLGPSYGQVSDITRGRLCRVSLVLTL